MNVLAAHQLTIGYRGSRQGDAVVAPNLSLALHAGEFVCLLGPNGAGKSTLLRTLAGMQPPLAGWVLLMGDEVNSLHPGERARRLSVVLTDRIDVGTLSAYALVALGRYPYTNWQGRLTEHDEICVRHALETVGAGALAVRSVSELSDGERQKVMIARALAQEPQVMLLDEPTAFLDLPRRVDIMQILRKLAHQAGRAVLVSTHDLDLALRSADKIWLLSPEHGLQVGAPEDLILSGAFEAAFRSEGVNFDPETGAFKVQTSSAGQIHLTGDGLPLIWTERALQRAGFQVAQNGTQAAVQVTITNKDNTYHWTVSHGGAAHEYDSIEDLMNGIREI